MKINSDFNTIIKVYNDKSYFISPCMHKKILKLDLSFTLNMHKAQNIIEFRNS